MMSSRRHVDLLGYESIHQFFFPVVKGFALLLLGTLTACGGGYQSEFSCKGYPDQAICESVSNAYANRFDKPAKVTEKHGGDSSSDHGVSKAAQDFPLPVNGAFAGRAESFLGKPIVTPPKTLQVWIAPWQDAKGRLHEATIVYQVVEGPRFVYGHQMGGKGAVTSSYGRSREFIPRNSRMVEPPSTRNRAGGPATASALSTVQAHEPTGGPTSGAERPPTMSPLPQGLPQMPVPGGASPYMLEDGPLGLPAMP
jgi:type IV conjugative transfer system lipoprotein TraV